MHEMPVFLVEDIWQAVQGPTTLVELAVEQKEANTRLVEHHYVFCTLLHAILVYSVKSIKPLSLYDTKVLGRISVLLVNSYYVAVLVVGALCIAISLFVCLIWACNSELSCRKLGNFVCRFCIATASYIAILHVTFYTLLPHLHVLFSAMPFSRSSRAF